MRDSAWVSTYPCLHVKDICVIEVSFPSVSSEHYCPVAVNLDKGVAFYCRRLLSSGRLSWPHTCRKERWKTRLYVDPSNPFCSLQVLVIYLVCVLCPTLKAIHVYCIFFLHTGNLPVMCVATTCVWQSCWRSVIRPVHDQMFVGVPSCLETSHNL